MRALVVPDDVDGRRVAGVVDAGEGVGLLVVHRERGRLVCRLAADDGVGQHKIAHHQIVFGGGRCGGQGGDRQRSRGDPTVAAGPELAPSDGRGSEFMSSRSL